MSGPADISLQTQLITLIEVTNQRRNGYPDLVRKGKLRQSEADYRIAGIEAASQTLSEVVRAEAGVTLAPAQIDLFKTWMTRAEDAKLTLELKRKHAEAGNDWVVATESISSTEIIAVARLLQDLATLARRADLGA